MSFDWKKLIGGVAPTLATALVGPLAGAATAAISQALTGKPDATEGELAAAAGGAGVEVLQKLKDAENLFKTDMAKLGVDVMRISAGDTANARDREVKTGDVWTPRVLAAAVIFGWLFVQWFLLKNVVPTEMREIVLRGLGTMDLAVGLVLGYYFGSSIGSDKMKDLFSTLANKK